MIGVLRPLTIWIGGDDVVNDFGNFVIRLPCEVDRAKIREFGEWKDEKSIFFDDDYFFFIDSVCWV